MSTIQGPILRNARRIFRKWRKKKYKDWKDSKFPRLRGQTMFGPAKDPEIAENIHLDTPANARESTKWLTKEWNKAKKSKDKERMKHLKKSAVLAANRAKVGSENYRVSSKEQKEYKQIEKIYRNWYKNKKLP